MTAVKVVKQSGQLSVLVSAGCGQAQWSRQSKEDKTLNNSEEWKTVHLFLFFQNAYLFERKSIKEGRQGERKQEEEEGKGERDRVREVQISWFTHQMSTTARAGPGSSHEPRTQSWSLIWW